MGRGGAWDTVSVLTQKVLKAVLEEALLVRVPSGNCKIKSIYVDPVSGKLVAEYEDIPVE